MEDLPDNLVLYILAYLPVKDRCLSGRVGRRWRRICNDNSLWRHVDLTPYRLNLKKTWKVIRSHLSECLLTIKLRGYTDRNKPNWRSPTLSNAMLKDLRDRCPNIKELHLYAVNIENFDASELPNTLVQLAIHQCLWPPGWIKAATLPNLRVLNLAKTSRIDKTEASDICKFSTVEELSLNSCYRVTEDCVKMLVENLLSLTRLELADTQCTDLALHHMCRRLPNLTHLDISRCKHITDGGVETIALGFVKLVSLNISSCVQLTGQCLKPLRKLPGLRTLICVQNKAITDDKIEEFRLQVPLCLVTTSTADTGSDCSK